MKKRSYLFPLMMLSTLTLASCNNNAKPTPVVVEATLTNLIVKAPKKTTYLVGEDLELDGLVVNAIFSDGTTKEVSSSEVTISGFSSETSGTCKVNVSYTKDEITKTDSFIVTIVSPIVLPISLYQNDSRLYMASFDEKNSFCLKTYHHKDFGDIPYINVEELLAPYIVFGEHARGFDNLGNGQYKLHRPSGDDNGYILFDTNLQKIVIENASGIYTDLFGINNGIGDFGAGATLIRGSKKTKVISSGVTREISLSKYGYRIEDQKHHLYVPVSLISGLLFAPAVSGLTYNGHDYFIRQALDNVNLSPLAYSSDKGFALVSTAGSAKQFYKPVAVKDENEAYRYEAKLNTSSVEGAKIDMVLTKDGKGYAKSNEHPLMPQVDLAILWNKDKEFLTLDLYQQMMGEPMGMPRKVKVRLDNSSYFGLTSRNSVLALDNYRGLTFSLDLNFGLKGFKGITDFDDYFSKNNRKDGLLSLDVETYQDTLIKVVAIDFDEMHSSVIDQSYYGDFDKNTYCSGKFNDYMGARTKKFYDDLVKLKGYYEDSKNTRETYEISGNTAILKFDNFYYKTCLAYNDKSYQTADYTAAQNLYYKAWSNQDTYKAIAVAFNDIVKHGDEIKNIVFDVAMNLGGEVRVMPLLSAFYNKDPNMIVKNNIDGSVVDLHYEADLNNDDEWATDDDTFEGKYNFYFLTGPCSFSCGNAFPTLAKNSTKAKIIGEKSAGGSCMVNAFVTMDGFTLNTSSAYQFMLDNKDGSYVYNENGVPLDYSLACSEAYNMPKLVNFINNLNN